MDWLRNKKGQKKCTAINIARLVLPFIFKFCLSVCLSVSQSHEQLLLSTKYAAVTLYRPAACSLKTHILHDYRLCVLKLGRPPTCIRLSYGTHTAGNYTCWQVPGLRMLVRLLSIKMGTGMENGETTLTVLKNPSHYHTVHQKFHTGWHGIEPGPPQWQVSN